MGSLVLNVRLRASGFDPGAIADVVVYDGAREAARRTLSDTDVRTQGAILNFSIPFTHRGGGVSVEVTAAGNGRLGLDLFELFPQRFLLALEPGSGELGASTRIVIETAPDVSASELSISADGRDLGPTLRALLASGDAQVTTTEFRRLLSVAVGELLGPIDDPVELRVSGPSGAARMQVRGAPPPCLWEGDTSGPRVLVTGFQPFPASSRGENVSGVAVTALRPERLAGVRVMRLVLPVEYDQAAAEVLSAIRRCSPDAVVSFGQGSSRLALEQTAYNLKDTSEVAGGVPDNRGVIAAAVPIVRGGAPELSSGLPLPAIAAALDAIGERPTSSTDPGRYICNNVFYATRDALAGSSVPSGFIHLPNTRSFTPSSRLRWGGVAEAVVTAIAASVD